MWLAVCALVVAGVSPLKAGGGRVEGTLDGFGKGPFLVYVDSIPAADTPPAKTAVMNQVGNTYLPHILPIMAGSSVEFRNADPELHNVYARALKRDFVLFNKGIPAGAKPFVQIFPRPEVVKLTCNVHKEMLAYIVVLQNRHFVLVDKGVSQFTLKDVPSGPQTLRVWAERLDPATLARRFPVDLKSGTTVRVALKQEGEKP